MESLPKNPTNNSSQEKLLYDINNSSNSLEDNEYCPHIQNHFFNPYMNSILKKILIQSPNQATNANTNNTQKKYDSIYFSNLSLFQNSFKSYMYLDYPQYLNIFNSFLLKNLSLDFLLYRNPQNLPINTINNEGGCIFSLNFNDAGNIMSASSPQNLEIWDVSKRRLKKILSDHSEIVTDVEFLHGEENNSNFLSCSLDKTIKLYKNFKNICTFHEHNDWVRALSISYDNNHFLSGCVSSVVKLWDLNKKIVIGNIINQNENQNFMNTVNSLNFFRTNPYLFMVGFRSGDIKIFDTRTNGTNDDANNAANNNIKNIGVVQTFKAHNEKLNTSKINQSDKYILTSGRDSSLRLWDLRKIYNIYLDPNVVAPKNDPNPNFINEYKKHKCSNYNVECNFYNEEKYLMTGSETGSIFIYDIMNNNIYKEIKTHLKCVNLIKQIPNYSNAFAFAGLAENAVFVYDSNKSISKFYEKEENSNSEEEKYIFDDDEIKEDKTQELCNNIIEEIMKEYGDVILKAFHKNNMTYNSGLNFQNILEIMQKNGDDNSFQMIQKIFLEKIMKNFSQFELSKTQKGEKVDKNKNQKKEQVSQKYEIKCYDCKLNENSKNINEKNDEGNNIFNCVDKEELKQLLVLPNHCEFNVLNEI